MIERFVGLCSFWVFLTLTELCASFSSVELCALRRLFLYGGLLGAPRSWPPTTAQLFAAWPCWHLAPLWSAFAAFGGQWNSQKMSKDVKRETTQNWKLNKTEQNSETGCGWTRIKCHEMSSCGDSWYCSSWIDSVVFLFLYRNIFTVHVFWSFESFRSRFSSWNALNALSWTALQASQLLRRAKLAREGGPWLAFRDDQLTTYWYHLRDKVVTFENPYFGSLR